MTIPLITSVYAKEFRQEINSGWQFTQAGKADWLPATVPGTVHTDLMDNKRIEDPFYRENEKKVQWIDKVDWEYRCTFDAAPDIVGQQNIELVFNGLDTYADVYLNGKKILYADNMFHIWRTDVKGLLKPQGNELLVHFYSPIQKGLALLKKSPYPYPAENDQSKQGELGDKRISIFTRKAPYHYGWDWGPRLVTSGFWRPVELRAWSDAKVEDTYIYTNTISDKQAGLTARMEIDADAAINGTLEITDTGTGMVLLQKPVALAAGKNTLSEAFIVKNPKLWWSNGLGEPNLYTFNVAVKNANGELLAEKNVRTGIRLVKLVREKDADGQGESFYFELNGVPVFAKGANYIPNDNFLPRVSEADYRKVVADAADVHMNMLRVWGGGIYENDLFYDLCDENGIMVWQDFMFACSMYPGDKEFIESIRQEAEDNVIRMRNHPSIVLWCGNNEMDTAWQGDVKDGGWGWTKRYTPKQIKEISDTYVLLFHKMLPEVVSEYTEGIPYWPSSPMAGPEINNHADVKKRSGDMHYWGVWHVLQPFESFNTELARFMSEYGFQSFPEFNTVKRYALPEDYDIESPVMASHQRSGIGNLRIKEYMGGYFKVPTDFEEFLYMGQVLQGYGMKRGMEAHRLAMPFCMGTLFWQINDCWPVASWSSTDYYKRWKAMHYRTREAYLPLLVASTMQNDSLRVGYASDMLQSQEATMRMEVLTLDGEPVYTETLPVTIAANTGATIKKYSIQELCKGRSPKELFVKYTLLNGNRVLAQNHDILVLPKELQLKNPEIQVKVTTNGSKKRITLLSPSYVSFAYLTLPEEPIQFEDNWFDLLPGEAYSTEIETPYSEEELLSKLKIMHVGSLKTAVAVDNAKK